MGERERGGKERKAESWPDSKPVERHALGKEKQTKRGWTRRLENHRCDSRQVPIGRPVDRYVYMYIKLGQASSCLLHPLCRILAPLGKSFPSM